MTEQAIFMRQLRMQPHSPYSASKASSDMLVKAYIDTYHFPANVTHTVLTIMDHISSRRS